MTATSTPSCGPQPLDCPVCPRGALPPGTLACPNCETALTPLWRLRDLGARYYNDGLEAALRGDTESAIRKLICALELGADEASTRLLLGKLLWRCGQRAQATAHWRAVELAAPNRPEPTPLLRMAHRSRQLRRLAAAAALLLTCAAAIPLWSGLARSGPSTPTPTSTTPPQPPPAPQTPSAFTALARPRQCLERSPHTQRPALCAPR